LLLEYMTFVSGSVGNTIPRVVTHDMNSPAFTRATCEEQWALGKPYSVWL